MSSKSPINIGFIGLSSKGWGAMSHYPALSHPSLESSFKITATHTSSQTSAQITAETYSSKPGVATPIATYYGPDASQVARDPNVDVVAVSVKVPEHKEYIEAAIDAGKHYFVEYPPARNLEETLELHKKTEEKGLISFVGLQGRQSTAINKVKKIIDSGKIGKVLSTTVVAHYPRSLLFLKPEVLSPFAYTLDPANGASLLTIPIGHQVDTLTYLLGPFTSLNARKSTQYPVATILPSDSESGEPRTVPSSVPDHYTITGQLETGAHASIVWRSGYTSTPGRSQLLWIIDGEAGSIKFQSDATAPFPAGLTSITDPKIEVDAKSLDDYLRDEEIEIDSEADQDLVIEEAEKGTHVEFIRKSWVEFGKAVRGGKGSFTTMLDAIKLFRILNAIEESASHGGKEVVLGK